MLIRLIVCGVMGAARLIEIGYSKRNLRGHNDGRESSLNRSIFPLIVTLHAGVIAGTLLFGAGRVRLRWLLLLLVVQPLRYWVLWTLGARWNARGAVPAEMEIATTGPYAHLRHPNYSIVAVELLALPSAFGLMHLALAASILNGALMTIRVREEEAYLFTLPGYREHFARKRRFIPGVC